MSFDYRLRFARREPVIWLGHLDMMRTFERTIRRAGLPVSWSQGFNPRPHLEFALPGSVGLASEDDYVDILMTEPVEERLLVSLLNSSFPGGLQALEARQITAEGPSLMSLIAASDYLLQGAGLAAAAGRLLAVPEGQPWPAEKNSKGKRVSVDIRPLLLTLAIESEDRLLVRVKAGSRENLRPDLLLKVLADLGGLSEQDAADIAVTRKLLWIRDPARTDGKGDGRPDMDQLIRPFDLTGAVKP